MKHRGMILIHGGGLLLTFLLAWLHTWAQTKNADGMGVVVQYLLLPLALTATIALLVTLYAGGLAVWCAREHAGRGLLFGGLFLLLLLLVFAVCFGKGFLRQVVSWNLLRFLCLEAVAMLVLQGLFSAGRLFQRSEK